MQRDFFKREGFLAKVAEDLITLKNLQNQLAWKIKESSVGLANPALLVCDPLGCTVAIEAHLTEKSAAILIHALIRTNDDFYCRK
jgi:hypothetical protein